MAAARPMRVKMANEKRILKIEKCIEKLYKGGLKKSNLGWNCWQFKENVE